MENIRILALSGSLRKKSYNSALINAVAKLAPNRIKIVIFDEMDTLPLFNPDRESENINVIRKLKNELKKSNGLLISSPEYAHGISGVLKNALDWLVSGDEFPYIPVALVNTSPRATHAQIALREVISTMSGNIIESASMVVPLLGTDFDANAIINDDKISQYIIKKINIFKDEIINC
ncbi:MAG: NADPH-dependent FMN reductase [Thiohalomonadales bacterium]